MAKVDTDKFIALLVETYCRIRGIDRKYVQTYIDDVLEQMGFKVENGEIVELRPHVSNPILDLPLNSLKLSVRTRSCLKANGIETVRELAMLNKSDWLNFRNCDRKSLTELDDFLKENNLEWGMDV